MTHAHLHIRANGPSADEVKEFLADIPAGGTCRTLGDALMLGWLDGGQDVGT